jgi:hypothetical protein
MNRITLGIVCILLSGFANAQAVHHPENRDIVGFFLERPSASTMMAL